VKIEFGDGICPRTESDSQTTEVEDDADTWGRLVRWESEEERKMPHGPWLAAGLRPLSS
jgi:hypothetical protein